MNVQLLLTVSERCASMVHLLWMNKLQKGLTLAVLGPTHIAMKQTTVHLAMWPPMPHVI